jgi:hypothetical protein
MIFLYTILKCLIIFQVLKEYIFQIVSYPYFIKEG